MILINSGQIDEAGVLLETAKYVYHNDNNDDHHDDDNHNDDNHDDANHDDDNHSILYTLFCILTYDCITMRLLFGIILNYQEIAF